jgi:tripartite-type tricarboxylate transporter receptor subunit TctC
LFDESLLAISSALPSLKAPFGDKLIGLFAPAKIPPEAIDRLNKSAATAAKSEAFKRLGVNEGLVMVASPPDELDRYFKAEEARWRKMIKGGIKVK